MASFDAYDNHCNCPLGLYPESELWHAMREKIEEHQRKTQGLLNYMENVREEPIKSSPDEAPGVLVNQRVSSSGTRSGLANYRRSEALNGRKLGGTDDDSYDSNTVLYSEPIRMPVPTLPPDQSHKRTDFAKYPGCFMYLHTIASTTSSETIIARETLAPETGRIVCMKVFWKKNVLANDLLSYPIRELLAYKRLAHAPKICGDNFVMKLEGCMQDKRRLFFAMQLMQCDLANILRGEAPHRPIQAQRWVAQIAAGLAAIHAAGIIHRDIKPANILIDTQDNIKITDFGSSYINEAGGSLDPRATYCDHVAGTRGYMAPEMIFNRGLGRKYGLQVDYWGLGCIAYQLELKSPKSPFHTKEDLNRYWSWDSDLFGGRSYFSCAGIDEEAEVVISGLLHLDPEDRFDARDLVEQPYFLDARGESYFTDIERRALTRPSIPLHHDFAEYYHEALVPPEFFQPHWEGMDQDNKSGQHTFDHFGWIHPRGFWSSLNESPFLSE